MDLRTRVTVLVVVGVGVFLVLLGMDVIPQRTFRPKVPSWLLIAIGLALMLAGSSVVFRVGSPTATRMLGLAMLLLAVLFLWVAVFGDARQMRGGIPVLPDSVNRFLGRLVFFLGGVFWVWLGVSALRYAKCQPEEGLAEEDP